MATAFNPTLSAFMLKCRELQEVASQRFPFSMQIGFDYLARERVTELSLQYSFHRRTVRFDHTTERPGTWTNWVVAQCYDFNKDLIIFYRIGDM